MAVGRDQRHAAVTEQIVVTFGCDGLHPRLEWVDADWWLPLPFRLLHDQRRLRKQVEIADVVAVRMRQRHVGDIGRLEPELSELTLDRLLHSPIAGAARL